MRTHVRGALQRRNGSLCTFNSVQLWEKVKKNERSIVDGQVNAFFFFSFNAPNLQLYPTSSSYTGTQVQRVYMLTCWWVPLGTRIYQPRESRTPLFLPHNDPFWTKTLFFFTLLFLFWYSNPLLYLVTECDGVRLFPIEQDSRKLDLTSHFCLVSVNCLMTSIVRGSKPRNRISNKYEHYAVADNSRSINRSLNHH